MAWSLGLKREREREGEGCTVVTAVTSEIDTRGRI